MLRERLKRKASPGWPRDRRGACSGKRDPEDYAGGTPNEISTDKKKPGDDAPGSLNQSDYY
jgi:hypothetical protein